MTPRAHLSDAEVEALLGAYALDACDPDETLAIESVLARRPDLASEAERLSRAATWIGATEALEPPRGLGESVLATARSRRDGPADAAIDLYLSATERFERAVEALPSDAYGAITPNGLSAYDLVVHMASQESLFSQNLGVPTLPGTRSVDIVDRTHELLPQFADQDLDEVLALWRDSIEVNRAWAVAHAGVTAPWSGLGLTRDDALIVRAFEAWIHGDDLRRVAGLDPAPPPPRELSIMSEFASRVLPVALGVAGRARDGKTARLVLTGDGGGDWLLAMGAGAVSGAPDVTITADVVDWCLLVGDRLAPSEIRCSIVGDAALGEDLLASAPALATL
ncbi:MAG: maleylpyruvate isomerase family mycothiol-dependent enzyme [Acidimicrobiia bacterium]